MHLASNKIFPIGGGVLLFASLPPFPCGDGSGGGSLSAMKVIPFALPGSGNYNGR